jgi:hypothetical protein
MKTMISKSVMIEAIKLSAEWNNTGFIILNRSGVPEASVWQMYKYENPKPDVVAYVNGNDGFVLQDHNYEFEVDANELL